MKCQHTERRTLYQRGPKATGSKFIPWGVVCVKCHKAFKNEVKPDTLACINYPKGCRSEVAIKASDPALAADELMAEAERLGWAIDGSGESGWAKCPSCKGDLPRDTEAYLRHAGAFMPEAKEVPRGR